MLRELLLSIASGVIVAVILQVFRLGGRGNGGMSQSMNTYNTARPRRGGSFFGGLVRLVLAVAGGMALAYSAAPFILPRRFRDYGGGDRFDGFEGISAYTPMLILTVVGTIIVWMLLAAIMRR